jgi:hypothetical protein
MDSTRKYHNGMNPDFIRNEYLPLVTDWKPETDGQGGQRLATISKDWTGKAGRKRDGKVITLSATKQPALVIALASFATETGLALVKCMVADPPRYTGEVILPADVLTLAAKTERTKSDGPRKAKSTAREIDAWEQAVQAGRDGMGGGIPATCESAINGLQTETTQFPVATKREGDKVVEIAGKLKFVQGTATTATWRKLFPTCSRQTYTTLMDAIHAMRADRLARAKTALESGNIALYIDLMDGPGGYNSCNAVERSAMSIAQGCSIFTPDAPVATETAPTETAPIAA